MNILIIGSEGFLGNHLARYFLKQSHVVTGCDVVSPAQEIDYAFTLNDRQKFCFKEFFFNL